MNPGLSPVEKKYYSGKLEFLALKWAVCEHFTDYLYYAPHFTVYTDNNPLTYALTTARLNATGHRWVAELSEFKFDIKYRPGHSNRYADALSRMPVNFTSYMDSCTNNITLYQIKAGIDGISAQATGDAIWISAVTLDRSLVENDKDFLTDDQPTISKYEIQQAQKARSGNEQGTSFQVGGTTPSNRSHKRITTWNETIATPEAQAKN